MDLNLQGKNALVGGSSRGIGMAAALEIAKLGANVTLMARNEAALQAVQEELDTSLGQQHDYLIADVSKTTELLSIIDKLTASKTIHILVNNTGGPPAGPIVNAKLEEFEQAFRNHLLCNHLLAQSVLPGMKASGYGRIINVISTSVKQPLQGLGVSNTVRGAVGNWAKTLANEVAGDGITVNNVLPGATATDRLHEIIQGKAKKTGQTEEAVANAMKAGIPAGRFAQPKEVGAAVAFLASPAAAYINGINVPVDGGRTKSL